jgi:rRNA maturation endonuclease Nob1
VLDAGAFYAGTSFLSSDVMLYTTSLILDEVMHIKSRLSALEALRDAGRLVVQDPIAESIHKVTHTARKTGDSKVLSEADVSIIALALELKEPLVTDDRSAANVASILQIAVKPATTGKEIQGTRRWINYCSACSRTFGPNEIECPLCGNKLKRKFKQVHTELR